MKLTGVSLNKILAPTFYAYRIYKKSTMIKRMQFYHFCLFILPAQPTDRKNILQKTLQQWISSSLEPQPTLMAK